MLLSSLLLLLLVCSTQAAHYLGTVMTYYPGNTNPNGSVQVDLRYKLNFHHCSYFDWECMSGNCGTESLEIHNIDEESSGAWCQTEVISTRHVPSNAPFELWLDGGDWIDNITNGIVSWRAVTLVELRNRSDTGKANTSPQTTILPEMRVPSNCQRDFSLLAFDPDGDNVKCRYGNVSLSECNPCTPPSVLNLSSSCTLSFTPTSRSNEGPYAVQLVMEDFPTDTITLTQTDGTHTNLTSNDAISKIPVQFVLRVDPVVPSCTEGLYLPIFLPPTPTNGAQLYTSVSQMVAINISAEASISTVSELLFSGPSNVANNTLGPGQYSLTWTPSQTEYGGSYPICFVVKAVYNASTYNSDLRCVVVIVGDYPPTAAPPASVSDTIATPTTTNTTTFREIHNQLLLNISSLNAPLATLSTPAPTSTTPSSETYPPTAAPPASVSDTIATPTTTNTTTFREIHNQLLLNISSLNAPLATLSTPAPTSTTPSSETYPPTAAPPASVSDTIATPTTTNTTTFREIHNQLLLNISSLNAPLATLSTPAPTSTTPSSETYPPTAAPPASVSDTIATPTTTNTTIFPATVVVSAPAPTSTTPSSETYVIGLRVKLSSLYQLSNDEIIYYISQVNYLLPSWGLPSATVNIVSIVEQAIGHYSQQVS